MADIRNTTAPTALVPVRGAPSAARVAAAREAQRAFFEVALATAPAPEPQAASQSAAPATQPQGVSGRPLRPGAILDIKV